VICAAHGLDIPAFPARIWTPVGRRQPSRPEGARARGLGAHRVPKLVFRAPRYSRSV